MNTADMKSDLEIIRDKINVLIQILEPEVEKESVSSDSHDIYFRLLDSIDSIEDALSLCDRKEKK